MFWTLNTKAQKRPKKQCLLLLWPSLLSRALPLQCWSRQEVIEPQGAHKASWGLEMWPGAYSLLDARAALGQGRGRGRCILMAWMILVCLVRNTNIGAVFVHRGRLGTSLFPGFSASEIPVLPGNCSLRKDRLSLSPTSDSILSLS